MRSVATFAALAGLAALTVRTESARAAEPTPLTPDQVHLDASANAPSTTLPEAPAEAPPPLPHKQGLVLEGSLGALGFMGQFRHVAPPAIWLHAQLGYDVTRWLMVFGEGELAFTDTSTAQDAVQARAFPIVGFGGGLRFTLRVTERVAIHAQGSLDGMKADVPKGALVNLGYRDAEGLTPAFAARVGVKWLQVDRHMAIGVALGFRDATGFAKIAAKSDTGFMADASAVIGYTF